MLIEASRVITKPAEELHFCDVCRRQANNGCTDALQDLTGAWAESEWRYGCVMHPVESMVYFNDSRVMTAKEFNA